MTPPRPSVVLSRNTLRGIALGSWRSRRARDRGTAGQALGGGRFSGSTFVRFVGSSRLGRDVPHPEKGEDERR